MKQSAGILLFKKVKHELFVLLAHPGGPYWQNKDLGVWSIPKGEFSDSEDPLEAAIREFEEEIGQKIDGEFIAIEPVKLKSGKVVFAWALERDLDVSVLKSNWFKIEWPPRSGKQISIPEVDKAEWVSIGQALEKIHPAQAGFLTQLQEKLKTG